MPQWLPEGNVARPSDDKMRSAAKWCQLLFDSNGEKPSPFPEGCAPRPSDDLQRLLAKIDYLQKP